MNLFLRRLAPGLTGLVLLSMSCSDPLPTTSPPDSELRLQIHAATGHEPPECTDFGTADATIEITALGFEPDCAQVRLGSVLYIVNATETEKRFIVGDPADSEVGRHIRVDEAVGPGGRYSLDPVDGLLDDQIYPFWLQGLQEEGYSGSLVVSP